MTKSPNVNSTPANQTSQSEAIDFAKDIKPKTCFPVHEGGLKNPAFILGLPPIILEPFGIKFKVLEINKAEEF